MLLMWVVTWQGEPQAMFVDKGQADEYRSGMVYMYPDDMQAAESVNWQVSRFIVSEYKQC